MDISDLGRRRDDVDISDIAYIRELERRAQERAEMRLEMAHAVLLDENNDEPLPMDHEGDELAGPFCGCLTCEVREALDAAWPFLQRLAWSTCWCGGHRGPRTPADADGWGCLEDINHRGERLWEEPVDAPSPEPGAWQHTCMSSGDEATCPGCALKRRGER